LTLGITLPRRALLTTQADGTSCQYRVDIGLLNGALDEAQMAAKCEAEQSHSRTLYHYYDTPDARGEILFGVRRCQDDNKAPPTFCVMQLIPRTTRHFC
jgi:hypothetical protein